MPDYIFLTGHRKSGTTLLRALFDNYERATTYPTDVGLLYAYFPCFTGNAGNSNETLRERASLVIRRSLDATNATAGRKASVDKILASFWQQLGNGDLRRRSSVLDALGRAWCEHEGLDPDSATVVFKETSQAIFFDEIKADLPSLKMIHLLRDPRDNYAALKVGVANYYAALGENELMTLASLINRCRMDMIAARINVKLYPEAFLPIKFEDLVHQPKEALDKACRFLGWEFRDSMLSPTILGKPTSGNSHEGKTFSGINSSHAGAWRERISAAEAKVIEYWCEREMRSWGYEPAFSEAETQAEFARFYAWYNCQYFYSDSFSKR
jgi:hypothetical protein